MRRVVVIALAVLILGPSGVRASTWYRNNDSGELRASCCCPTRAGHHGTPRSRDRVVRSVCCCTITELAAREGAVRGVPPIVPGISPVAVPVETLVLAAPVPIARLDRPAMTRGPPDRIGLFVRHCSLLL